MCKSVAVYMRRDKEKALEIKQKAIEIEEKAIELMQKELEIAQLGAHRGALFRAYLKSQAELEVRFPNLQVLLLFFVVIYVFTCVCIVWNLCGCLDLRQALRLMWFSWSS